MEINLVKLFLKAKLVVFFGGTMQNPTKMKQNTNVTKSLNCIAEQTKLSSFSFPQSDSEDGNSFWVYTVDKQNDEINKRI